MKANIEEEIDFIRLVQEQEIIGTIGSPNGIDEYVIDFRSTAFKKPLYGNVAAFIHSEFENEEIKRKIILCVITEILTRNTWHETTVLKSIIKERGYIPYLSENSDTKSGRLLMLSSLIKEGNELIATTMGSTPSSGITVYELPIDLLQNYKMKSRWNLGFWNNTKIPLPVEIRHFGDSKDDGLGEAHFTGIFGKTGSGKTVFAAQVLAGYAKHQNMGILLLDPQGEFHKNKLGGSTEFEYDFLATILAARRNSKKIKNLSIRDFSLDSDNVDIYFKLLVVSGLLGRLGLEEGAKKASNMEELKEILFKEISSGNKTTNNISYEEFIDHCIQTVNATYKQGTALTGMINRLNDRKNNQSLERIYNGIIEVFSTNKNSLEDLIKLFLEDKCFIILDISDWDITKIGSIDLTTLKAMVLNEIIFKILNVAQMNFRDKNETTNGLIVIDEAHNYVPQIEDHMGDEEKSLASKLASSVRVSRKLGIGWMFITQSITDFSKEIFKNLHNYFFLYGLQIGRDKDHLISVVGKENSKLYDAFADPKSTGKFPVLLQGSSVRFSTKAAPVSIISFNSDKQFMEHNQLLEQYEEAKRLVTSDTNIFSLENQILDEDEKEDVENFKM